MKRLAATLTIAVLVAVVGVTSLGTAFAQAPQEGQFDPAKLRAAIEACRCSSSLMDLQSKWNRERDEAGARLYSEAYRQAQAVELSRDVYWGVPSIMADTPGSARRPWFESGTQALALASSGSLMDRMSRLNGTFFEIGSSEQASASSGWVMEMMSQRNEALRQREAMIRAGEGALMDMMSARN